MTPWLRRKLILWGSVAGVLIVVIVAFGLFARERTRVIRLSDYAAERFAELAPACLGIWQFNEIDDGVAANDCPRVSTPGAKVVGAKQVSGANGGKALRFDNQSYAALGVKYGAPHLSRFSACAWFRTSHRCSTAECNWSIVDFDDDQFYNLYVHGDGRLGFSSMSRDGGGDDLLSSARVNDGRWHYACAVYDSLDKKLYLDNRLDAIGANAHEGQPIGTDVVRFGVLGDGSEAALFDGKRNEQYFTGDIDDVRIYSDAIPLQ